MKQKMLLLMLSVFLMVALLIEIKIKIESEQEVIANVEQEQKEEQPEEQPEEETAPDTEDKDLEYEDIEDKDTDTEEVEVTIQYEDYQGEIPHIFMHALIAYPEVKDRSGYMIYDNDCIDVTEFKRLLNQLYQNGYSLIDINESFYQDQNGKMKVSESVQVPVGRKPLIFSVDDLVYDVKKRGNGMVDFLALDENQNFISGTYQQNGEILYSDDQEFIPILERFIEEHPDFSSHGARATLCMTGFTGLFGYRTDHHNTTDRQAQIEQAKKVANRLKELGYTFASHSYGHYDVTKQTVKSLKEDLTYFKEEVEPIIGKTNIYVYPYGKILYPDDERYQLLLENGFQTFCSVSNFFYLRDYEEGHSIYMTRVAIDGYSLRNYRTVLKPVCDVTKVLDQDNR